MPHKFASQNSHQGAMRLLVATPLPLQPLRHTHRPYRDSTKRRAWMQGDAATLFQTASAAVLSSALTSAWIALQGGRHANGNHRSDATARGDSQQDAALSSSVAGEPASADDIWQQAWAAFTTSPDETSTPSETLDAHQEEGALPQHPLLWLQGIRHTERIKLLAVSLAALEQQVATLNPSNLMSAQPELLNASCTEALAGATLAAAQAWLGYVPKQLETQLHAMHMSNVSHGRDSNDDTENETASTTPKGMQNSIGEFIDLTDDEKQQPPWYMLSQRLGLYGSVLRLLKCNTIQSQVAAADTLSDDKGKTRGTSAEHESSIGLDAVAKSLSPRQLGAQLLRQQQQQQSIATSTNIRGWTAAAGGPSSSASSQLLAIAPSVVQDMAVLVADAVAAAYLDDVASGLDTSILTAPVAGIQRAVDQHRRQRKAGLNDQDTTLEPTNSTSMQLQIQNQQLGAYNASLGSIDAPPARSLEFSFWPTFTHPRLSSTRQLQRFANLITVHRWADRNLKSAAAIVEDRLPLFTLAAGVNIRMLQAPLRRGAELEALKGLQLAASLVLEGMDLITPILSALWSKAGAALSWMLTHVIGKTLGLVYQGVKSGAEASARSSSQKRRNKKAGKQPSDKQAVPGRPSSTENGLGSSGWGGQRPEFGM